MKDYAAIATQYARDVVAGAIPNCQWVRLAAQRHLTDLEESAAYYFDADEANRVCAFIECLPHVKGKWARDKQTIVLEPWQCFIVACLFGWLRQSDGLRRFRETYLKIPRKNGKSVLAAAVGLVLLLLDGEHGAEVYSGATSEKQAWEVFRPARMMLQRLEELQELTGAEVWAKALVVEENGSRFEPVIGKPGDGSSPHGGIVDEYHEHDGPDMVDTFQTGMGAREQPLLLIITTAGYNLAGPCYEKELQAERVLQGVAENPELFAVMYGIDKGDDWASADVLRKANPNFGVSVSGEFLEAQQRQAVQNAANQTRFRTKHLNEWVSAGVAWINAVDWRAAADTMLTREEAREVADFAVVAADLASKLDLAAAQTLFRRDVGGKPHYYLFGRYWLPEEQVEEPGPNQSAYRQWMIDGWLTVTPGAVVDYDTIAQTIAADAKAAGAAEFVFDPFNATHLSQMVAGEGGDGLTLVEFQQKPWNFAVPMDEFEAALRDGRVHHDGNPITAWCMANVVAKVSKKDMVAPTKQSRASKIDGAVAAVMAFSRAVTPETDSAGVSNWLNDPIK